MNVIRQTAHFNASAARLYDIYLSPKRHAAVIGAKVTIGRRPGSKFRAFDGRLSGEMLLTVPKRLIVQRWRSVAFRRNDTDSLLILTFADTRQGGRIDMTHIGVPDHDLRGVRYGWPKYYWRPMRKYLSITRVK